MTIKEYKEKLEKIIMSNIDNKIKRGEVINNSDMEQIVGVVANCKFSEETTMHLIDTILTNVGLLELNIETYKNLIRIQEVSDTLRISRSNRARESVLIDWGE